MPSNNSTSRRVAKRKAKRSAEKRIASLVIKEVSKLSSQIAARVHSLSHSRASEDVKTGEPQSTFLYKHFKACDPMEFTGEGGATQLLQWFDSIEVTLRQSGCPDSLRTTCATGVFQSRALDWWTAERNKRGISAAYALSWNELKELMEKEYCPPHEIQKLENEFWEIKQTEGDNAGYTARFKQLSIICPSQVNTPGKAIAKYIRGLPECVGDFVEAARPATIEETYRLAAEINNKRLMEGLFSKNPVKQAHQAIASNPSGEHVDESSDESTDESSDKSTGDSSNESANDSSDGSANDSSDGSAADSSDKSADGSSDKSAKDSASESSDESSNDDTSSQDTDKPSRKRKTSSPNSSTTELLQPEPLRTVPTFPKRAYTGFHPQCYSCTYHHPVGADCRYCNNCNRYGHFTRNCRIEP